jgi:hypothetical protein
MFLTPPFLFEHQPSPTGECIKIHAFLYDKETENESVVNQVFG